MAADFGKMMKKVGRIDKAKLSLIVVFLFIASMIGEAMLSRAPSQDNEQAAVALPPENFVEREFSQPERYAIMDAGMLLTTLKEPESCSSCAGVESFLKLKISEFDNKVYVSKQVGGVSVPTLSVHGLMREEDVVLNGTINDTFVNDIICGNIIVRPKKCVLAKLGY